MRTDYVGALPNDNYAYKKQSWQDKSVDNTCIEQDMAEVFNQNANLYHRVADAIVINEAACRLVAKEAHKAAIKDRRKEIQYGWMLAKCTNGDIDILCNDKNRVVIEDGADKVQRYGNVISQKFPDGLVVVTGDGDDDFMTIPVNCVEDIEQMTSLTTQMLFDKYTKILVDQILADYSDTENITVAQFEEKNYVTDTGAYNDTVDTAIADDAVFAQPITNPSQEV